MQTNSSVHNHTHSASYEQVNSINTYNQSPVDADSFPLDQSSYQSLISSLDRLSPFEAIRYAKEINGMNGFEVVGRVEVGRWKRELQDHFQKIKMVCDKAETISKIKKVANPKVISKIKECSNPKGDDYRKAYLKLLNT